MYLTNEDKMNDSPNDPSGKLTDAKGLLKQLWDDESRPSLRWLRQQQRCRSIPYVKIGHLVFFDPKKVHAALLMRHSVEARKAP